MGLLSTDAKTLLATGLVPLGFFAELEFKPGTERYWNGIAPLTWDGDTWDGTAGFAAIGDLDSSEDFRSNGLTLTIAGLPSSEFANFDALTAADYKGSRARFVIALMDPGFQTVVHAIQRFYFIDTLDYSIDPDAGAACTVGLEVETRRASRARVRRYTPQDQQKEFPGDQAFEFVPYIASGVDVEWGKNGSFFNPT